MKPSHLATIMLAGLGMGGMSTAAIQSPSAIVSSQSTAGMNASKAAMIQRGHSSDDIFTASIRGGAMKGEAPPDSWRRKNQRQIRLNRRRSFAAGNKKAFA